MDENTRIVEINGIKMEIDLRQAKIVENYRVGDSVKLLRKRYSDYEVLPAAIVGFTEFKNLPSIELLAVDRSGEVSFFVWNEKSEGMEIAPFNKYEMMFDYSDILDKLNKDLEQKKAAVASAEAKRKAFVETFAKVFDLQPSA
jgi:hypothetical protein